MREAGGDSTKELIRRAEELLHQLRPIENAESANTSMPRTQAAAVSQSGKGESHVLIKKNCDFGAKKESKAKDAFYRFFLFIADVSFDIDRIIFEAEEQQRRQGNY